MGLARTILIGGVLAALVIAFASARGMFDAPSGIPILTEPVVLGVVEDTVLANGVLEPSRMVSVGAQVSGQLTALHVDLGELVKAGDLIAEIDSTAQSNALRVAEANLANVMAQKKARGIALRQAENAYNRQLSMASQKAASPADVETAEAAFLVLQAENEALEAQIAQVTVEVENARANLGYTKVRAPMDGVVVAVATRAGQTLNSSQAVPTIVVLAQLDIMRVKVQISEADISRVKPGLDVRFSTMGDTSPPTTARLEQIEPAPVSITTEASGSASTGQSGSSGQGATAAVYFNGLFQTPNTDGRLRPMMTVVVTIVVGRAEGVPLVPWSALTNREADGRYRVTVRAPSGTLSERLVTVGVTDRIKAQIIEGLQVGEDVVIPADGEVSDMGDMVAM